MASAVPEVKMNDLIEAVAEDLDMTKTDVRDVIKTFFEIAVEELKEGNQVALTPYMRIKFKIKPAIKKGTMTRNPGTGETYPRPTAKPAEISVAIRPLTGFTSATPAVSSKVGKSIIDGLKKVTA